MTFWTTKKDQIEENCWVGPNVLNVMDMKKKQCLKLGLFVFGKAEARVCVSWHIKFVVFFPKNKFVANVVYAIQQSKNQAIVFNVVDE